MSIFLERLSRSVSKLKGGWLSFFLPAFFLAAAGGCSSSVWNNPHGILGGALFPLFGGGSGQSSTSSGGSQKPIPTQGPIPSTGTESPDDLSRSLSPPEFVHVVPFSEGDGVYLQWSLVAGATDYFLYKDGRLVADTPSSIYKLYGLLPCHHYHLALWSSDSVRLSKKPLSFVVHTRGCASPPKD